MDYCHPCQRHLNGALACAGCGTPAEALAPYAVPARSGHEPEASDEAPESSGPGGRRRRARGAPAGARGRRAERGTRAAEPAGREPLAEISGQPHRETRSERRAGRGHRRRGRGVLLGVLGVALALGTLSLAELAVETRGEDGAADFVREAAATRTEPAPGPSGSVLPDDPGPVGSGGATDVPTPGAHTSAAGSAEPSGSGAPEKSGETTAPADASLSPSASASASVDPDDSGGPADPSGPGGASTPAHTDPPQQQDPTPSPTETESGTCFLWWCA